jgi:hypothetical protein
MPTERFPILTGTSEVIPVTGVFYTADMSNSQNNSGQIYLEFFSDAAGTIPVTPTAGTINFLGSPLGNNYLSMSAGSTVNATTVSTTNSTYTPPTFYGRCVRISATLSGITGASYARIVVWRF